MEWSIERFLDALKSTFEWTELYMDCKSQGLRLLNAGQNLQNAWHYLWIAKDYLEEEEWKVWQEIYWDFYKDLMDYISE